MNFEHVIHGGDKNGTWVCEDLALIFAHWISPKFYKWTIQILKQLLKTGSVSLTDHTRLLEEKWRFRYAV